MSLESAPNDHAKLVALSPAGRTGMLFLVSVLGLFLELLLIRWIGTELRIFAYLQNTVLVVCFLGLGMGCWTCRRPFVLRQLLAPLFVLVLLLAVPPSRVALGKISELLSVFGDLVIWFNQDSRGFWEKGGFALLGLSLAFFVMLIIWSIFVPIGRLLGQLLADHPHTIWAYSVNIAGSLVGIWLFVALSGLHQPPVTWFALVALMALLLLVRFQPTLTPQSRVQRLRPVLDAALIVGMVALAWWAGREPGAREVTWSPYQKLALWRAPDDAAGWQPSAIYREVLLGEREPAGPWLGDYIVTVNNVGYQVMMDLSDAHVRADPERYPPEMRGYSQYDLPLLFHPNPRKVLSVGSGTGNDVAGALRGGATDIVAVEIDPVIIDLGRRFHPERPYDSPAVRLVNDDARSYFATCNEQFDVIAFGLLDSHTTTAMTNARLDHYVYTRESIARAKALLKPGGVMVLSFEAQKPYIADRMARVLTEVFGHEPLGFNIPGSSYGWGSVMFVSGDQEAIRRQLAANPGLAEKITAWQEQAPLQLTGATQVTTDDWPYIYLKSPSIPVLYFLLAGILLLLFWRGIRVLKAPTILTGWDRSQWHFLFLGAAFMLLEVQNISKAAVVLGNTWLVNAVIISGILVMILLANWIAARWPRLPLGPVYLLLCVTCLGLYFVDLSRFGFLPYASKALLVGGLTSLPMLFSGIVFIRSFAAAPGKDAALGANLIGALAGGLLQSVTFVTGIQELLLLVAVLYLAALLARPRQVAAVAEEMVVVEGPRSMGTDKIVHPTATPRP